MLLKGKTHQAGTLSIYVPARFGIPVLDGSNAQITHMDSIPGGQRIEVAVHGSYGVHILGK